MKLLVADGGQCVINAEYIASIRIKCGQSVTVENEKAYVLCGPCFVVADMEDGKEYRVVDNVSEVEAKTKLRKIGNYLSTDASFMIDFNQE